MIPSIPYRARRSAPGIDIQATSPLVIQAMASANKSPTLDSYFAPLTGSFWIFFLILSALVAPVWAFDLGEAQIRAAVHARDLQAALLWLSKVVDVAWITVAAVIVYSSVVRVTGLEAARRWALLVLAGSWLTGALSAWSGWPLGSIHFTGRIGFLVGPVSIGWMLIWCVIILGARDFALAAFPRASHTLSSVLTGMFAALSVFNLEPLAAKTRAWWLWLEPSPKPPFLHMIQSFLAWFIVASTLAWCLRGPLSAGRAPLRIPKSAQVFLILNLLLILAHLGRLLRQ